MELLIRELEIQDIPSVANVYVKAFADGDWNEKWTNKDAEKRIYEIVSSPICKGIVCMSKDEIIGCVLFEKLTWHTGKQLEIKEVFVLPSSQGKGVGKKLLEYVESSEIENDGCELFLWTNKSKSLLDFYSKMGYHENSKTTQLIKILKRRN